MPTAMTMAFELRLIQILHLKESAMTSICFDLHRKLPANPARRVFAGCAASGVPWPRCPLAPSSRRALVRDAPRFGCWITNCK